MTDTASNAEYKYIINLLSDWKTLTLPTNVPLGYMNAAINLDPAPVFESHIKYNTELRG